MTVPNKPPSGNPSPFLDLDALLADMPDAMLRTLRAPFLDHAAASLCPHCLTRCGRGLGEPCRVELAAVRAGLTRSENTLTFTGCTFEGAEEELREMMAKMWSHGSVDADGWQDQKRIAATPEQVSIIRECMSAQEARAFAPRPGDPIAVNINGSTFRGFVAAPRLPSPAGLAVLRALGAAFAAIEPTLRRRAIDDVLREDARRFPAFATARRAAVVATMDRSPMHPALADDAVPTLLADLGRHEEQRGGRREPVTGGPMFGEWMRAGAGGLWLVALEAYERARAL